MDDDPDLDDVIAGELRLLDPAVRHSPDIAGELIDPEFREFGSSGSTWDRESILAMMATDEVRRVEAEEVVAVRLAADVVLLTYRTRSAQRITLRSSVWHRRPGEPWRILFHQGTVVPDS